MGPLTCHLYSSSFIRSGQPQVVPLACFVAVGPASAGGAAATAFALRSLTATAVMRVRDLRDNSARFDRSPGLEVLHPAGTSSVTAARDPASTAGEAPTVPSVTSCPTAARDQAKRRGGDLRSVDAQLGRSRSHQSSHFHRDDRGRPETRGSVKPPERLPSSVYLLAPRAARRR
jgi:hypothetical protein